MHPSSASSKPRELRLLLQMHSSAPSSKIQEPCPLPQMSNQSSAPFNRELRAPSSRSIICALQPRAPIFKCRALPQVNGCKNTLQQTMPSCESSKGQESRQRPQALSQWSAPRELPINASSRLISAQKCSQKGRAVRRISS